jgi:hypothetical protein
MQEKIENYAKNGLKLWRFGYEFLENRSNP